jgi:CBS domain containing-hemolysin-like protein
MLLDIIFTIFLVLLNGFFVAAEFAIVKIRSSQIEIKAATGNRIAKVAYNIVNNLDAYLSATQLGITLASLGLGWIGESVVAQIIINSFAAFGTTLDDHTAHQWAVPIAFTLITVLHIVFGELAPKTIAIRYSEATTMAVAMPLRVFYMVFRPFIVVLNGFANLILRAIGIKPIHATDSHTEEELRLLLMQSKESGSIKTSEHELIENVFKFDERTAKQIMVSRTKISAIDISMTFDEILNEMLNEGYSRMPVYNDSIDNIVGIINTKDLLKIIREEGEKSLDKIIRKAYFIPETKKVKNLLREFQKEHTHIAIVLDEFGGTAGLVTMEDIIEELVGDIQDEYDEEVPVVQAKKEREFIVNAQTPIADLNKYLPFDLPEGDGYDSLAGLMNTIFGKIPDVGEQKEYHGYIFTILNKSSNAIESVLITIPEEKKYPDDQK